MSMSELADPEIIHLPPGFRFHPTDEEIITHYLTEKVMNSSFTAIAMGEVDLNKCEPWDLSKKAKMGEKEWYFFTQKDRKYPTGLRTNRATESGYWKATGKDKEIYRGKNCLVGMKKTLVFYLGRAPKGEKTNWVMHEYRLEGKFSYSNLPKVSKDEWVVCRIFHKSTGIKKLTSLIMPKINSLMYGDDLSSGSLPPLMEPASSMGPSSSLADAVDNEFKGMICKGSSIQISRSSDANFPSWSLSFDPCQGLIMGSNPCPTYPLNLSSNFSMLNDQVHNPNFFSVEASAINPTYLPDQAQHEVDPFSNRSMISSHSQETALSTDKNSEMSSSTAALKQELTSNRPIDDQTEGPLVGLSNSSDILDFTWDY